MASPWKFLTRLTSGWREQKPPQDDPNDDMKSEKTTSHEPVDVATTHTPNSGEGLGEQEPQLAGQADAAMKVPERSAEAGSRVQVKVILESARSGDGTAGALSNDGNFIATSTPKALASVLSRKGLGEKQKRSREATVVQSAKIILQPPTSIPTFAVEITSLDEEITLLREQLGRKLQLQNAQLRTMLERFER